MAMQPGPPPHWCCHQLHPDTCTVPGRRTLKYFFYNEAICEEKLQKILLKGEGKHVACLLKAPPGPGVWGCFLNV